MSSITTTYSTKTKPTTSSAGGTTSDSLATKNTSPTTSTARSTTSNSPACAVCKYRRRRCASDCILAPYFPADHQKDFLNVHKLFGVSNMIRVLQSIKDPADKENAMKTMIYEANVRALDPSRGCCRIIDHLQRQVCYYKAQLDNVCTMVDGCRTRELHGGFNHHNQNQMSALDLQCKTYNDMDFNNVGNYLDENQLLMAESWRESDNDLNMHFVDGVEVLNGGAGKKPLLEHHIRGKFVEKYMENEHSVIKYENNC